MILALLIWLTFLNFVKKFLPLGLQCLLRNSWNYSRIKWLSECLWDVYLVCMYFLMWITVHLLTPNLHFISQSHFCCAVSFSFIFSSDNSSKYGKGQPWYKHDCCCRMAAPGHYRNTLMLLCQAEIRRPKPISHLNPCCACRRGQTALEPGRMNCCCVCVSHLAASTSGSPIYTFRRFSSPWNLVATLHLLLTSLARICSFGQLVTACSQCRNAEPGTNTSLHRAVPALESTLLHFHSSY